MALKFRKKKEHKELKKRVIVLFVVFLVSFAFFEVVLNLEKTSTTVAKQECTLPILSAFSINREIGRFVGYTVPMEAGYMRDSLVPLEDDRRFKLIINPYGANVSDAIYEIRTMDSSRKIADNNLDIASFEKEDGVLKKDIELENLIEPGIEYLLLITLKADEKDIYYYMRVLLPDEANERECLDFADYFHETTMSSSYRELATYIEPSGDAPSGFSQVSLNSTLNQIAWQGFRGEQKGGAIIKVNEINDSYTTVSMEFQMEDTTEGDQHLYNVNEYYRMRKGTERIFLLDYKRNMTEVITEDSMIGRPDRIVLGMNEKIPAYKSNEMGTVVGYEWDGELYTYNTVTQKLKKIFSFADGDIVDERANNKDHSIDILYVNENGDMDFIVYGYMSSGEHEGQCGIKLMHFDSELSQAREEVFLRTTKSYQVLKNSLSGSPYWANNSKLYISLEDELFKVDITNKRIDVLIESVDEEKLAISQDGRYCAWTEDDGSTLVAMDLSNETKETQRLNSDEAFRVLTFLNNDLVYGKYRKVDCVTDATGNAIKPMYSVVIQSVKNGFDEVLKEYDGGNRFITEVVQENDSNLTMILSSKKEDTYLPTGEDSIQNTFSGTEGVVIEQATGDEDKNKMQIKFNRLDKNGDDLSLGNKIDVAEMLSNEMVFDVEPNDKKCYYVYSGNEIIEKGNSLLSLIPRAEEAKGFILDNQQTYVWAYGRKVVKEPIGPIHTSDNKWDRIPEAECLDIILTYEGKESAADIKVAAGEKPISILQEAMEDCTVIDLKGCDLSRVLSYVSRDHIVYVGSGSNDALLIVGYDQNAIVVYDPTTDSKVRKNMESASKMFYEKGNPFIAYVKKY